MKNREFIALVLIIALCFNFFALPAALFYKNNYHWAVNFLLYYLISILITLSLIPVHKILRFIFINLINLINGFMFYFTINSEHPDLKLNPIILKFILNTNTNEALSTIANLMAAGPKSNPLYYVLMVIVSSYIILFCYKKIDSGITKTSPNSH